MGPAHDGPVPPGPPGRRAAHVPDDPRGVLVDELGLEPGPELHKLEQRIPRAGSVAAARSRPRGRTGAQARNHAGSGASRTVSASIIGRDDVLAELGEELTRARLVTLLGPGGAGKTTIATELAGRATNRSVTFVEFAPLTDPDSVIPAIASELGISVGDTPAAAAGFSMLDRVIDASAPAAPYCSCSTTASTSWTPRPRPCTSSSRHVPTSWCWRPAVRPWVSPARRSGRCPLGSDAAVRLFVERARVAAPDLNDGDLDVAVVADPAGGSTRSRWRSSWRRLASGRCT